MVYPIGNRMPTSPRLLLLLERGEGTRFPDVPGAALDVSDDLDACVAALARGEHEGVIVSARLGEEARGRVRAACGGGVPVLVVGGDADEEERRRVDERAKTLVAQLTKAEEINTIGEMASSLAHELHQPLGAVVNYLNAARHLLGGDAPDLERIGEAVARSIRQAERAADILHGMRAFVYRDPPGRVDACLNELIAEVCDLTLGQTRLYGVEVVRDFARDLPSTRINAVQFQQVVMNVIGNAIEALRETVDGPRRLTVSTRYDAEDGFVVAVADTGPGFPEDQLEEMFEPFFSTRAGGMGMGLAICRRFVEAHGGRLSARVNDPVPGLTFRISLPLQRGGRRD